MGLRRRVRNRVRPGRVMVTGVVARRIVSSTLILVPILVIVSPSFPPTTYTMYSSVVTRHKTVPLRTKKMVVAMIRLTDESADGAELLTADGRSGLLMCEHELSTGGADVMFDVGEPLKDLGANRIAISL